MSGELHGLKTLYLLKKSGYQSWSSFFLLKGREESSFVRLIGMQFPQLTKESKLACSACWGSSSCSKRCYPALSLRNCGLFFGVSERWPIQQLKRIICRLNGFGYGYVCKSQKGQSMTTNLPRVRVPPLDFCLSWGGSSLSYNLLQEALRLFSQNRGWPCPCDNKAVVC